MGWVDFQVNAPSLRSYVPSHTGLVGATLPLEQLAPHILADTPFDEFALAGFGGFVLGRFDEMRAGAAVIATKAVIYRCLAAFHVKSLIPWFESLQRLDFRPCAIESKSAIVNRDERRRLFLWPFNFHLTVAGETCLKPISSQPLPHCIDAIRMTGAR